MPAEQAKASPGRIAMRRAHSGGSLRGAASPRLHRPVASLLTRIASLFGLISSLLCSLLFYSGEINDASEAIGKQR